MTVDSLKQQLKARSLSSSGNKRALTDRLKTYTRSPPGLDRLASASHATSANRMRREKQHPRVQLPLASVSDIHQEPNGIVSREGASAAQARLATAKNAPARDLVPVRLVPQPLGAA